MTALRWKQDGSVVLIIFAGLFVRMAFVSFYPQHDVTHDAAEYDHIALTLLTTGEYVSFQRAPLYPVFLAIIYKLFDHSYLAVRQAG